VVTDLSYICAYSQRDEKICKIIYAIVDNGYGIVAFPFGSGAELVTLEQSPYIGARF
jgi:hypothetical protein